MSSQAFSIGKEKRPAMTVSPFSKFVPGPGQYKQDKESLLRSSPNWGFGSGKRPDLSAPQSSKQLGPGAYDIKQRAIEGSQYSMGIINYKQKKYGSISPGPGAYKPQHDKIEVTHQYSMGQKLDHGSALQKPIGQSPGPGGYEPKYNFKYDGHTKFGTSQREGLCNEKLAKSIPSPFQYKQDAKFIQKAAPNFRFGTEKQRPQTSKEILVKPGPGHYQVKHSIGVGNDSQGKTLAKKLFPSFEQPGSNKVPGPGTYQSDYKIMKKSEPNWKIGTSKRDDQENVMRRVCNFPPPGGYNPNYGVSQNTNPLWGFGSGKRGGLTIGKSDAPSMQTYNIPSKAVEGSKWIMGLKLDNRGALSTNVLKVPGPGNYNPDFKQSVKSNPAFSIKGRYQPQKTLNVPGPGTYKSSLFGKKAAPQFGFGTSPQRDPMKGTPSPGPGGYKIPSKIADLPSYALQRSDEFKYI